MTRTDELTAKLLDGTLGEAEWAELESLFAADPAALRDHLSLMELEAVLRGERTEFDLVGPTLARVKAAQEEKTTLAVMAEIATQARAGVGRAREAREALAAVGVRAKRCGRRRGRVTRRVAAGNDEAGDHRAGAARGGGGR